MIAPVGEMFRLADSVADGTRPATAWGTQLTPAENAYGSYGQLIAGASVTDDAHGILININSAASSTFARDCLVTIGIDPAGGSSYSTFIEHLLGSCAGSYASAQCGAGGVWYYFPVRVPAGASLAAKASVNASTVGTVNVACSLWRSTRPDAVYVGSFVQTFGATAASSSGTSVTAGTTGEGAWVSVGTVTVPIRAWEVGMGINDPTMTVNTHHCEVGIGDASSKKLAIHDHPVVINSAESLGKAAACSYRTAAVGDVVYVRCQVGPSAADASLSMIAYGVGG
jgi:hypothetical protein